MIQLKRDDEQYNFNPIYSSKPEEQNVIIRQNHVHVPEKKYLVKYSNSYKKKPESTLDLLSSKRKTEHVNFKKIAKEISQTSKFITHQNTARSSVKLSPLKPVEPGASPLDVRTIFEKISTPYQITFYKTKDTEVKHIMKQVDKLNESQ